MTRRAFLKNTALLGTVISLPGFSAGLCKAPLLRPPGAAPDFLAKCIRCGKCIEACPYDSIRLSGLASGTEIYAPYIDPLQAPCYLCLERGPDGRSRPLGQFLRCGETCPTGALKLIPNRMEALSRLPEELKTGTASLNRKLCLAWQFNFCGDCYFNCPLKDKALLPRPPGENMLAVGILPYVDKKACTGCGRCVYVCPVRKTVADPLNGDESDYFQQKYGPVVQIMLSRYKDNTDFPAIRVLK